MILNLRAVPVCRFFNSDLGSHLFTTFEVERDQLIDNTIFIFQGIGFRATSNDTASTAPVYRFFNQEIGGDFFTANEAEKDAIIDFPQWPLKGKLFMLLFS